MELLNRKALIFYMKYVKYFKDFVILHILIFSLVSLRNNKSEIENLKVELENTKNNLYQTNEVIGFMQNQSANKD